MTVMMKNYIYTILLLIMPLMATAQDVPVNEYSKALGDSAYSQERYSDAVRIYETVITNEGGSSDLYYNLGNAFFRSDGTQSVLDNSVRLSDFGFGKG
jgi:hypothetical protein